MVPASGSLIKQQGRERQCSTPVRQSRAMASARKPVIVRKFSRDWCAGLRGQPTSGNRKPELEILDLTGKVVRVGWEQVKWVCYVRDLPAGSSDQANPERLLRKRFSLRPRTAGLWLRLTLADGDELEGLAANDRTAGGRRGIVADPARYALEHAADLCAQAGHPGAGGAEPDWSSGPQAG